MTESTQQHFDKLWSLLQQEKEEDLIQFRRKVQRLSLEERKAEGFCWYPVSVAQQGYTIGDRAFVVVERTPGDRNEHQFREGKTVSFFTRKEGVHRGEYSGVIHYLDKNRMKIILNTQDIPDWSDQGLTGVDLLFDDRSYAEMEKALKQIMQAKKGRIAELRAILTGGKQPEFDEKTPLSPIPGLNPSQYKAVCEALSARDVAVIHGPPGTGKTTTIVQAVKAACQTETTVLVTAPSNTAVDLLTERLAAQGLFVVRIGNISRVDESILSHTLEVLAASHPESKNVKKVRIQAAECRRQARRFRRQFGSEERSERRQLLDEAKQLASWANTLEDRIIEQILDGAQVIACTLVGAAQKVLEKRHFRTAVIDEASQALEPASWIPILRTSRVWLTGDPFQLPPTVKSDQARREGLNLSLMERCLLFMPYAPMLEVQYRMHEVIMGFSNRRFYGLRLKSHETVSAHRLDIGEHFPLEFIDTAGCGFEEQTHEESQSRFNPDEFHILREHLYQLIEAHHDRPLPSVAIISPYREQAEYIKKAVETDPLLASAPLSVNTIDGFQGQERDVVYISLVRSNAKSEIGFLGDYRRMNVAMTRARKLLVVIGDSATVGANPFYSDLLSYCEQHGIYRTAWEFMA
ncbi:MAG: AAA family ATPase [Saprospiraceae bacterium]|nr:AAA family ATPase [Saprospiraceae bacterium]